MITAISLCRNPETAITPADNTFHRWSAPRGGRHNRVREDLLGVVVPEHGRSVHRKASISPILARSRSARRTPAGKAELSGRNARIPLIMFQVDYQRLLERAMAAAAATAGRGQVADYIPALASVDPDAFGMAVATSDGEIYGVGQVERPFSIQSVSKLFSLALLLAEIGDRVWQGVGREPSGNPFNSLVQLESERGIPRNPFINAGALVVTDRLLSATGDAAGEVREFLRTESGNSKLDTDRVVARSEAERGHRNAALAHFIASYGNLQNPVDWVLDHYYAQCAIEASCRDLALAGLFLSKHGVRVDGRRLLGRTDAKRMNAVMLTCGTYDAAGEFAYRVGLPAKSGVGGGVLAVIPQHGTLCAWGPRLDAAGNSVAAIAALDEFTTASGLSVF
jgi:glutaminase